jgi:integrase
MQALNIKVPRLGKNRLGVFFVRSSVKDANGQASVAQLSLRTKDPALAKLLGLEFCIHIAKGGTLASFKPGVLTYTIKFGQDSIEADGEDDHKRALEAMEKLLQVQRMKLEVQRLEADSERLADREPAAQEIGTPLVSAHQSVLLRDEFHRHLQEEKNRKMKAQTLREKQAVFEDFLNCFGVDVLLNSITQSEITHRWRDEEFNRENKKQLEQKRKLDAKEGSERIEVKTLSPNRLEKRRGYLSKFFSWAITAGTYTSANPMVQPMYSKKDIQKSTQSYREFTTEDIRRLFCQAYQEEMAKEPDWYWVPLIALYSGARLGEICDLEVASFEIIDGIKVFLIKDGKTNASKRTIPIHSKLLELGLWEYVQALKARDCTSILPQEPDKYKSKSVGRQWSEWINVCGITDTQKTFHSFRSTAITEMHNAGENQAGHIAIKRSVGHATPGSAGAHGGYVRGLDLEKLQSAIESIVHGGFDVSHLRLLDPTFKAFFDRHFELIASPGYQARKKRNEKNLKIKASRDAADKT